jgi:exodeoxyribonuclease V alpha subunit
MNLTKISNRNTSHAEIMTIRGMISKVIFTNPESGYTVLSVDSDRKINGESRISVQANIHNPAPSAMIEARGRWEFHKKYGLQFKAEVVKLTSPDSKSGVNAGINKYLGNSVAETLTIHGKISRVVYTNPESDYAVLAVDLKHKINGKSRVSVIGTVPKPVDGATIEAQGRWEIDKKYGQQFRADIIALSLPTTKSGMEKYLTELDIKGVGPIRAQKIVNAFGKDTFYIIEHQPGRLVEVPGITQEIADNIVSTWNEKQEGRKEFQFLASLGVGGTTAQAIWRAYKTKTIPKITKNPYILSDIDGIGFKKADSIALRSGISQDAPERIKAALFYVLRHESKNRGHVFLPKSELLGMAYDLFDKTIPESKILMGIAELEESGNLHIEESSDNDDQIYLKSLYVAETGVAECLGRLLQSCDDNGSLRFVTFEEARNKMRESMDGKEPSETQVEALMMAVNKRVSVITGGPGTGKTTIIKSITSLHDTMQKDICLAAPTGRAAKRMEVSTGVKATTIHRLLEYSPDESGQMIFHRNAETPLDGKLFIVDEMSMTDLSLMHSFLQALPYGARLIFVGDADQLPSVGPGNVLHDLITSGVVPTCKLDRNFRQQQDGSAIIESAHRIIHGEMPILNGADNSDFKFIEIGSDVNNDDICEMIVELVKNDLPKKCGVSPLEIQVLSPMNKREPKVDTLNFALQKALNPPARGSLKDESGNVPGELKIKKKDKDDKEGVTFRVGDKVMQRRNNYKLEVYNGDVGIITSIDHEDKIMIVDMGVSGLFERNVYYDFQTVQKENEMSLAYASTIHKAQGSEYPVVIMPVMMTHYNMLRRNLLYTGVTRGKEKVVLVGTREALRRAVENEQTDKRFTNLAQRIRNMTQPEEESPCPTP